MKKPAIQFLLGSLALGTLAFAFLLFFPRSYPSRGFHERQGVQYWELPTGSRIGYTLIPGRNNPKPTPIIYLHGGPGGFIGENHIAMLTPLADDGYDVYLYDQVGSGEDIFGRMKERF